MLLILFMSSDLQVSQVQKADLLSDVCTPYNVKLKFILCCTTFIMFALFPYAANVENFSTVQLCS